MKGIYSGTYKIRILTTDPIVNFLASIPGRDFPEL
jgi:hypothetical protein